MRTPIFEVLATAAFLVAVFVYESYTDNQNDHYNTRQYCEAVYSGMIQDMRGTYHEQCYMGKIRTRPLHH